MIPLDNVAHIITTALTPVFLLSGIGTLLNLFNLRMSRVADHTAYAVGLLRAEDDALTLLLLQAHLRRLQRRRVALDAAIVLAALGAAFTCGAAFLLFVGGLRDAAVATWLFVLFGVALGGTMASLVAFLFETMLAWHGMHREGPMPQGLTKPL